MEIKVLGTGCARCKQLHAAAERAIAHARMPVTLTKVERLDEIMKFEVLMTPALVVAGEVKSSGRIPEAAEIVTWIMNAAAKE